MPYQKSLNLEENIMTSYTVKQFEAIATNLERLINSGHAPNPELYAAFAIKFEQIADLEEKEAKKLNSVIQDIDPELVNNSDMVDECKALQRKIQHYREAAKYCHKIAENK